MTKNRKIKIYELSKSDGKKLIIGGSFAILVMTGAVSALGATTGYYNFDSGGVEWTFSWTRFAVAWAVFLATMSVGGFLAIREGMKPEGTKNCKKVDSFHHP